MGEGRGGSDCLDGGGKGVLVRLRGLRALAQGEMARPVLDTLSAAEGQSSGEAVQEHEKVRSEAKNPGFKHWFCLSGL